MNQNLFRMNNKYKKIGIVIIAILTIICVLRNVKFQSVNEYQAQKQSMVDEYNRNSEKQSGDLTADRKITGEVNTGSINSESDISTVDSSENNSIINNDQNSGQNSVDNNTINGISSNNDSDGRNISSDNSGGTTSDKDGKDNNGPTVSEIQYVTCTIEIRCDSLLNNMSKWTNKKPSNIIPSDGTILEKTTRKVKKGSTAYHVLINENIKVESSFSWAFNTYYIESIEQIGEKDAGDMSGWIYQVNGKTLSKGISAYEVQDGDSIRLLYTCNAGKDIE